MKYFRCERSRWCGIKGLRNFIPARTTKVMEVLSVSNAYLLLNRYRRTFRRETFRL